MMKQRPFVAFLCLFLALAVTLPLLAQTWRGRGRAQGRVMAPDGNGVEGAKVFLTWRDTGEGPEALTTDERGRWAILGLAGGTWNVRIEAEGFMVENGTVQVSGVQGGPSKPINVTLAPEPVQGPDVLGMVQEGNELLSAQKFPEARAKYEEALAELEPENHPPILLGVARTYFQEENAEQALATLDRALEIEPGNVDALKLAIQMLSISGQDDKAREYMARLPEGETVKLDPNVSLNRGIEAFNAGDLDTAFGHFETVVAENPELADGYYYRGLVHLQRGESEQALADFNKMLEIDPDHAEAETARQFITYLEQPSGE